MNNTTNGEKQSEGYDMVAEFGAYGLWLGGSRSWCV